MIWFGAMQKPNRSSNKLKMIQGNHFIYIKYIPTQRLHYSHEMKTPHHFTQYYPNIQWWIANMKRHEETTSIKKSGPISFSFSSAFRKVLAATRRKGKGVLVPSAYFHTQSGLSQLQPCHAVQTQASPLSWPPVKFASHNSSRFSISNIRLSKGSQESSLRHPSRPFNTIHKDIPTQGCWCCLIGCCNFWSSNLCITAPFRLASKWEPVSF